MSATTSEAAEVDPAPEHRRRGGLVADVLVVAVWSVVAGVVGGVVWRAVVHLPVATKVKGGAALEPVQLTREVSLDGWFFVVAVVGGLLAGVVLTAWRRRDPLLVVVLVVLGAGLSAWIALKVGHLLGPGDPTAALKGKADGATAPVPLVLKAPGAAWVWPLAAAVGSLAVLWGTSGVSRRRAADEA